MSHILHYVLALTFSILGFQLQKPAKVENTKVLSRITEIIRLDMPTERNLLSPDCTILIEKDNSLSKENLEKTKRIE